MPPKKVTDAKNVPKNTEKKAGERKQLSKLLNINMSTSRVKRHMNVLNVNKAIYEEVASLKAERAKMNAKRDAKKITAVEEKIKLLENSKTRFSEKSDVALTVIVDELVRQLLTHAMDRMLLQDKKTVRPSHLLEEGIEMLSLYPLVRNLQCVVNPPKEYEKKQVRDKLSFNHYIHEIGVSIKSSNEKYSNVKISGDIQQFGHMLVSQFIARLMPLVQLRIESMKVKTINESVILDTVRELLDDGLTGTIGFEYLSENKELRVSRTVTYENSRYQPLYTTVNEKMQKLNA